MQLPVDAHLDEIRAHLRQGNAVIEAPPGAGKTTRIPPALLADIAGEIWVTEPRRLAARLAATRVASELGEAVGDTCGYQVRFDERLSKRTRIRFVTEGILVRRLASDPELRGIGAILFDEIHERHLDGDLALALAVDLQRRHRPDLRLGAMSATLQGEELADYLGVVAPIRVEGRLYPVETTYASHDDRRPLEIQVRAALRPLLKQSNGHVLVFLPGAAQIRRSEGAISEVAAHAGYAVHTLHGDLPPAVQDRAVSPTNTGKVILTTNIAESSVTIPGVTAVIDSGLARIAGHSLLTGLPTLRTQRISRASCDQRTGRAGRESAGQCVRLYTQHDYETRPPHLPPELARADLTTAVLTVLSLGRAPLELPWWHAPPDEAVNQAVALLGALGAIDDAQAPTELGRTMLSLPMHPRLARMVVAGREQGVGDDCLAAAVLLSERDPRPRGDRSAEAELSGESDVVDWIDRWRDRSGLNRHALTMADRVVKRYGERQRRNDDTLTAEERDRRLRRAVLCGFPDRVARRTPGEQRLVLCQGGSADLAPESIVKQEEVAVVVRAEERRGRAVATAVSAIEIDWLLDLYPERLAETTTIDLDPDSGRAMVSSRLCYGNVTLDESRRPPAANELDEATRVVVETARKRGGLLALLPQDARDAAFGRAHTARTQLTDLELPAATEKEIDEALAAACDGCTSLSDLERAPLAAALSSCLFGAAEHRVRELLPEQYRLPGGRRVRIEYATDRPPWIASRLQDFFGVTETPRIAAGRIALTVHLLAPNQRPVQVTSDLAGFWERHYPAIKKQLERRYPRHAWPSDPTVVQAGMRPRRRK